MLPLLPLFTAGAIGSATFSFHLMKVKEVYPGSDTVPNAQYVVIQMYSPGQNLVSGKQIRVFNADGVMTNTFTFPSDMPVGSDQSNILIATVEAQGFFALVPNLTMTPVMSPLGGKVCFHDPQFVGDIDCVSWGGYAGAALGVGVPFNLPVGLQRGSAMQRRLDICGSPTILDSCDDTDDSANDFRPVTPAPRNNAGSPGVIPPSVCGNNNLESLEQCDDGNLAPGDGCSASCRRESTAFTAQALVVDPADNNVLEPGETAAIRPTWRNAASIALPMTGAASILFGPGPATYALPDRAGNYGTVASGANAGCLGTGDCYSVLITAAARPVTHWDTVWAEVMNTYSFKLWSLHVGNSFTDVPKTSPFYRFIETLLHRGVTGGCTATTFCPANTTTRDTMAVFVLVSKEGPSYAPPACGVPMFADVPADSPFCKWIEELARRGVASGCGGGNYCPGGAVTREQMAVFVLRTLDPALNPPNCTTPMFNDVPSSSPFCRWIEELARRGVVTGCGGGAYCPTAVVSREQMGVFLGVTFSLTLYGA
jgi:cysteine-rich repeat protein